MSNELEPAKVEWGCILDYEKLLYPQYCNENDFPSLSTLLETHKDELAKRAAVKLTENPPAYVDVKAHWERLVANGNKELKL